MHVATKRRQFPPTTTPKNVANPPPEILLLAPSLLLSTGQTKQIIFGGYRMQTENQKNSKNNKSPETQ